MPQSVGAQWGINQPLAEKSLVASDIVASPGTVTGTTKLVGAPSVDGVDCLELESRMTVGGIQSIGSLPPGSTVESSSVDIGLHLVLPVEEARG